MLLPEQSSEEGVISDSNNSELPLGLEAEYRSKLAIHDTAEAQSILPVNRWTRSGRIVKPV